MFKRLFVSLAVMAFAVVGTDMRKTKRLSSILAIGALILGGLLISPSSAAPAPAAGKGSGSGGGSTTVFDSIPSTLPGNVTSLAFESTSTSEFGDYARFAGNKRNLQKVTVIMSSWGCENGTYDNRDTYGLCSTTPGATFSHPITLNLYANPGEGVVGSRIATATETFAIPYRPSANPACEVPTKWMATDGTCYNGLATPITFTFTGVKLPASVIYGIAYNTTGFGYAPMGMRACNSVNPLGCGYDSLNVSAASTTPRIGTDDDVNGVFLNSSLPAFNCSATTGTFRLASPCYTGNNPMVRFVTRR